MCLIIALPKGATVSPEFLKVAAEANPDGWGFSFSRDGILYTKKGINMPNGLQLMEALASKSDDARMFHFRYATNGKKVKANSHPFIVNNRYAVMHNGINQRFAEDENISDSARFCDEWLSPLLSRFSIEDDEVQTLISGVDQLSRYAIQSAAGQIRLIGNWYKGQRGEYYSKAWPLSVSNLLL